MTLHLNLKREWFDMISQGKKKVEYREIKPYWTKRLFDKDYDTITFSNGYAKNRDQFVIEWKETHEAFGTIDWGAPIGKVVYCLVLGEIISKNF